MNEPHPSSGIAPSDHWEEVELYREDKNQEDAQEKVGD